jgi:truncated hemoglobin YjbI
MPDSNQPWAIRVSRVDSSAALDLLMDDWYDRVKADKGLHAAIGFDSYMEHRDWVSAKHSIERTYGRSSREHRQTLDTLAAAIQSKRMLTHRPVEKSSGS